MVQQYDVIHYNENGRDIFNDWVESIKDNKSQYAIYRATDKLRNGNFGKHRYCREGVWELKIDFGSGYRVYYSISGRRIILLLCGGDKRSQQKDIDNAVKYLKQYKEVHK